MRTYCRRRQGHRLACNPLNALGQRSPLRQGKAFNARRPHRSSPLVNTLPFVMQGSDTASERHTGLSRHRGLAGRKGNRRPAGGRVPAPQAAVRACNAFEESTRPAHRSRCLLRRPLGRGGPRSSTPCRRPSVRRTTPPGHKQSARTTTRSSPSCSPRDGRGVHHGQEAAAGQPAPAGRRPARADHLRPGHQGEDHRPAMASMVSVMCSRRPWWRARARQFFGCAMPCSTLTRREE